MRDYAGIRRVLIITMLLNWLATAVKIMIGYRTGTLSLTADGLDSFFDGFSNVVGLVAIAYAAMPPDREHPYGHRKFETLVAVGIALLLGITTWELIQGAVGRLMHPFLPSVTIWSYVVLVLGIGFQGGASIYEFRAGARLRSELLIADARHSAANIAVSAAVLLGLPFLQRGYAWVDPVLTLAVSLVIAKLGWDILRESMPVLLDRAPLDPEQIARVVEGVNGVTSYHRIRSRGSADEATVDLHVRVAPGLPMSRADAIADEVRERLKAEVDGVADVTVHVEPQRQEHASAAELYDAILHAAAARPVTIHEVWAYLDADGKTRAEAHIGVPPTLSVGEADRLVSDMEREVLDEVPWVDALHTHIEPAFRDLVAGQPLAPGQSEPLREIVRHAVEGVDGLSRPSNLVIHSTPEGLFLSLDVMVEPDLAVSTGHALAHVVAAEIRQRRPDVVDVAVRTRPASELKSP